MKYIFALFLCVFSFTANAIDNIPLKSNQCTKHFNHFERINHIPKKILFSVSFIETGLYDSKTKKNYPWPWSVNVNGRSYYYDNKNDAVKAVKKFQEQGYKSIDVGCMQINLLHHGDKFKSIDQALDPKINIATAAKMIKKHYERKKDWKIAVAHYHSKLQKHGGPYSEKVLAVWKKNVSHKHGGKNLFKTVPEPVLKPKLLALEEKIMADSL